MIITSLCRSVSGTLPLPWLSMGLYFEIKKNLDRNHERATKELRKLAERAPEERLKETLKDRPKVCRIRSPWGRQKALPVGT